MLAVVGYLIAIGVAIPIAWRVAGLRYQVNPDPSFELTEVAGRSVSILGGLAGFAVTGVVLIVAQTSNPGRSGGELSTVLAMFVVAYMGLLSTSVALANVSGSVRAPFDLTAALFAGAAISQYFIFIGWFALRPLFQAFGLIEMADITSWLLVAANLVGYGGLASSLYRSGYASVRTIAVLPLLAVAALVAYVVAVRILVPGGQVAGATLSLTLAGFIPGAAMSGLQAILPILARHERSARRLAERWHLVIVAYAISVMVLVELLLVSVLGLA